MLYNTFDGIRRYFIFVFVVKCLLLAYAGVKYILFLNCIGTSRLNLYIVFDYVFVNLIPL